MGYSVKVRDNRWINWCDEHWYETCDYDNRIFTHEEAEAIAKQLRDHYVYKCWICSDNGEELVSAFKPKSFTTPKQEVAEEVALHDILMLKKAAKRKIARK